MPVVCYQSSLDANRGCNLWRRTYYQQVQLLTDPGRLFTHVPLSSGSIIWYWPKAGDAVRLETYASALVYPLFVNPPILVIRQSYKRTKYIVPVKLLIISPIHLLVILPVQQNTYKYQLFHLLLVNPPLVAHFC